MNGENQNDNLKSEIDALLPKSLVPKPEQHPLHMLDNQADPATKPKIVLQKTIRTYESDVAEALSSKKNTMATVAIAESERRIKNPDEFKNVEEKGSFGKKLLITVISLIFVSAGIGGGYYLYLKSPLAVETPVVQQTKIASIITPDTQKALPITGLSNDAITKLLTTTLENEKVNDNKISEFIPTEIVNTTNQRVKNTDFIKKVGLNMPDVLSRSLTDKWMLGIYNSDNKNQPFIILKTDFFQNAFSGMLAWEALMPDEFSTIFDYKTKNDAENIDSSSTIRSFFTIHGKFEDRTILNRDVREFIDDNGEVLILYSFIDKDTLVIATSETTLKSIIGKIEQQAYIRYN